MKFLAKNLVKNDQEPPLSIYYDLNLILLEIIEQ
jgi:hypothetical protein